MALAAIQGLYQVMQGTLASASEQEAQIAALEAENAAQQEHITALQAQNAELEARLVALEEAIAGYSALALPGSEGAARAGASPAPTAGSLLFGGLIVAGLVLGRWRR